MDNSKITIGNVDFDEDSILCSKYRYENGQKLNYVFLVGGTKIVFPDQDTNNARVLLEKNSEISAWFNNIKGLIIENSPQKNRYYVS